MASDALVRAVMALEQPAYPSDVRRSFRAALDPTDEAMVEAMAVALHGGQYRSFTWESRTESLRAEYRRHARAAITALRDHITGEGA